LFIIHFSLKYVILFYTCSDPERKGKSGSSWTNITQAYKEDGKRFLFVDGSKGSFKNQSKSSSAKKDIPVSYLRPNTKALMDKLERGKHIDQLVGMGKFSVFIN